MSLKPVRFLFASLLTAASAQTHSAQVPLHALAPEDARAVRALERRVNEAARSTREWALERAFEALAVEGTTTFENLPREAAEDNTEENRGEDDDEGEGYRFPKLRPPGVGADEWQALQAFAAAGGGRDGERGIAQYTLLDIDGDGLRDLVMRIYNGGTSLVWETIVLHRKGGQFVAPAAASMPFFESGRGGNEEGRWIRLNGRVYLAWRTGKHGEDQVALVRPFAASTVAPVLRLRYRYAFGTPGPEDRQINKAAKPLPPALRRTIGAAIRQADSGVPPQRPLCPATADIDPDAEAAAFQSPHYFMEHIGAAPVRIGRRCFAGQLTGWFGSYTRKGGLAALFCLLPPGGGDAARTCYAVDGRRRLTGTARARA